MRVTKLAVCLGLVGMVGLGSRRQRLLQTRLRKLLLRHRRRLRLRRRRRRGRLGWPRC